MTRERDMARGDRIEWTSHDGSGLSVADIAALYQDEPDDPDFLMRLAELPGLAETWREHFRKRLSGVLAPRTKDAREA